MIHAGMAITIAIQATNAIMNKTTMRAVSIALSSPKNDLSARDCAKSYSIYIMYGVIGQAKAKQAVLYRAVLRQS